MALANKFEFCSMIYNKFFFYINKYCNVNDKYRGCISMVSESTICMLSRDKMSDVGYM